MQSEIDNLLDKFGQKRGKIDLSLKRITQFLAKIGSPQLKISPVIHVAGTNGKGSTIAFLKAMIEADNKICHVYTSPHLIKFNERIVIAGQQISDDDLLKLLREVDAAYEKYKHQIELTFFELTTIAAFIAFSKSKADYVLLETGMGGRLDATNIVVPLLTIITPISFDHTEFLGSTIEAIASEKAGIIKSKVPCISAPQSTEVVTVLRHKAEKMNSPIDFVEPRNSYGELSLKGQHQHINAAVASEAGRILGLGQDAIYQGLKSAGWPGRLQRITTGKLNDLLPKTFELWLDGAHNVAGAESLAVELDKTPGNKFLIIGMLSNRDVKSFLAKFSEIKMICTVSIPNHPECHDSAYLAECANQLNITAKPFENFVEAIKYITANCSTGIIYICGSLYLVGEVLKEI